MGCSLFSNSHFQIGVNVMGFAEHFGLRLVLTIRKRWVSKKLKVIILTSNKSMVMNKVNFKFSPKKFDQKTQNCVKTSYAKFINFFKH